MATSNIRAVITAQDNASKVVHQFGRNVEKSNKQVEKSTKQLTDRTAQYAVITAGAGIAARKLVGVITDTVDAANKEQAALTGLTSITKAFGVDTNKALKAAKDLRKDGLLSLSDAARGLKNLLQSGFSLDQAIKLMERFKDSAAFGRQNALSFGDAVASATEGIKNGNSILVDNAGVTKNLSRILEEAGFSAQDLMRATTDTNVRMALFNGIIKETNPQVGDAAKLTELYAGKQAMLSAKTNDLKVRIGEALQPALLRLLEAITPLIEKFAKFAEQHPKITAGILLIGVVATSLIAILGALGFALKGVATVFGITKAAGVASFGAIRTAAAGTLSGVKSFAAFIKSPAMLGPWGIFAAVAVGAFLKVRRELNVLNKELDGAEQSFRDLDASEAKFFASTDRAVKAGRISAAEGRRRKSAILQERAVGGAVSAGTPYMVGERRPEMFVPREAGRIVPQPKMGGSNQTINLNVNVGVYAGTEMEKRKLAESLMKAWQDLQQSRGIA